MIYLKAPVSRRALIRDQLTLNAESGFQRAGLCGRSGVNNQCTTGSRAYLVEAILTSTKRGHVYARRLACQRWVIVLNKDPG